MDKGHCSSFIQRRSEMAKGNRASRPARVEFEQHRSTILKTIPKSRRLPKPQSDKASKGKSTR